MPSSAQTVPVVVLFDYLLNSAGIAMPNETVNVTLNTRGATSISPLTTISNSQVSTTTDANGYWQVSLVPNTNIAPANTLYGVQTPLSAYDVTLGAAGPYQSTAVGTLVNAPASLTPATSNLTGPLTVAGLLTAQAGLAVTGGTTTDTLTISGGALSLAGPLTLTAAASQILPGVTSFAIRDNANANNNLLVSNAGLVTARAGLVATAGGLTVSAGGFAVTGNSTLAGTLSGLSGLTVTTGDETITAGRLVMGAASAKIVGGSASLSHRNNADSADNLLISDAGLATVRAGLVVTAGGLTVTAGATAIAFNAGNTVPTFLAPAENGKQIASGVVTLTIVNATREITGTITFGVTFGSAPRVFTGIQNSNVLAATESPAAANVWNVTTTGASVQLDSTNVVGANRAVNVAWVAIG